MIAIHKQVDRLLKIQVYTERAMPGEDFLTRAIRGPYRGDYAAFGSWFKTAILAIIQDPILDSIASTWGLTADDVLEFMKVVGVVEAASIVGGEPATPAAAYQEATHTIYISVPAHLLEDLEYVDLTNAFIHEFEHAARALAVGISGSPSMRMTDPIEGAWADILNEEEWSAIKAEMAEYLSLGYTDEQIIALALDRYVRGATPFEEWKPWMRQLVTMLEYQLNELLGQAKEEYTEFA